MSRILKRPMFRMGGSTENVGIMDGMRQRYLKGGNVDEFLKELGSPIASKVYLGFNPTLGVLPEDFSYVSEI